MGQPLHSLSHLSGVTSGPVQSGRVRAQAAWFGVTESSWERDVWKDVDILLNPGTFSKDLDKKLNPQVT